MTAKATGTAEWLYRDAVAIASAKTLEAERKLWEKWIEPALEERAEAEFRSGEGDASAAEDLAWLDRGLDAAIGEGDAGLLRAAALIFDAEVVE